MLGAGLPLEAEVILCGARSRLHAAAAARLLALLREDLDWDGLLQTAREHEVAPLLYWSLRGLPASAVPGAALDQLREWFYATAAHNLFMTTELLRFLEQLRAHGVLAVPFKGPVLAATAYGHPALRTFVDLDVLVDARDVPRVDRLLEADGYRPRDRLRGLERVAYLQSECSYDYTREDGRLTVEVHWGLMPRYFGFPLRLQDVRPRLTEAALGGATVPSLSAEDILLFLCLHGTKHRWVSLKWICDVAELIEVHPAIDWEWVERQAAALGGERMLRLGLFLATDLLGTHLPRQVAQELRTDPVVRTLATEVGRGLFGRPAGRPGAGNLFYVRAMTSPRRRVRYCLHLATVPTKEDWQRLPLPPILSFLYYPLHSLRLFGQVISEWRTYVRAAGAAAARSTSRATARRRLPTTNV